MRRRGPPRAVGGLATIASAPLVLATGYLLLVLAMATRRHAGAPAASDVPQLVVLVPAHDEEDLVGGTVASLMGGTYPPERQEVVVIADNCSDGTATAAAAAGATVWERQDPRRRGKPHAIAWALDRLWRERPGTEAVAMVDADCMADPRLLESLASRLGAGADAVQSDYVVSNADASPAAALRWAAFRLICTVRPLGKMALGVSVGLSGTGMAFRREVLERNPWRAFSIVEDLEYHASLVDAGHRVVFAPEVAVRSPMPTSLVKSQAQQARWESGKVPVVRRWAPLLLREGLRLRDPNRLHAGIELLVPPQSLLLPANVLVAVTATLVGARTGRRLALLSLVGQAVYVVGGLLLMRAPASAFRALALAPALVLRKLPIYVAAAVGRGEAEWVQARDRDPKPASEQGDAK